MVEELNPELAVVMEEGITTHKENFYLPEEYLEAAFKLDEGEVSDLVATPYGIILLSLRRNILKRLIL